MDLDDLQKVHAFIARKHLVDAGQCYQAAFLAAGLLCKRDLELEIVHGNPRHVGKARARRIGHAWNEVIDERYVVPHALVVDFSRPSLVVLPRDLYYSAGRITVTRRYTFEEAQALLDDQRRYGPWDHCFSQLLFNRKPESLAS